MFAEVTTAWRALPHERRRRVQIAALPMADPSENAAMVNALQRHAAVVVQKSLAEGFGLTVTEAMWKGRPVVASAVGGIGDQIEDGRDGILLPDPRDLDAYAGALRRVLGDPGLARRLGEAARERARREFLGIRQLADYAELVEELARARNRLSDGPGGRTGRACGKPAIRFRVAAVAGPPRAGDDGGAGRGFSMGDPDLHRPAPSGG